MKYCGERRWLFHTVFVNDEDDRIWEDAVAEDFMKGYSEKDAVYDKL